MFEHDEPKLLVREERKRRDGSSERKWSVKADDNLEEGGWSSQHEVTPRISSSQPSSTLLSAEQPDGGNTVIRVVLYKKMEKKTLTT
ncbi:Uncharacterized protein DAT39_011303 [Clarias magur]|uniref:Uncharacterized protein n=1 Tax=Clarias magur TaxID=1594786 RepID=A0A8J4UNK5_CLAMG|nr:Uncharacterized protein DAT39_011303 [Clarias magur]